MVATIDHLASQAGLAALQAGGSAADAAIAANAVLAVVAPHCCGLGGDLFAVVHPGPGREPVALNASGRAGSGADASRLRDQGHGMVPPFGDVRAGPVPGCVDGWLALHERFGRLPMVKLLEPARGYATEGFPVSPTLRAAAPAVADRQGAGELAVAARSEPGALIRRPGLGDTLQAVGERGRAGFYGGDPRRWLLELGDGEYAPADLDQFQAEWVEALEAPAWGRHLWTAPPNSQGYLTLAAAWIANGLPLPQDPREPSWAHLLVEAARQAGYDRPEVLHEGADGHLLLDPLRLEARRDAIDVERAAGQSWTAALGDTIGLVAVDADGMGLSLLQSNASSFGTELVIGGTESFLHNRGVGFSVEAGHPAEYGPGRRPPHTLSPLVVTSPDGRLEAVMATMGGDSQPQILLQLLARMFVAGEDPASALAAGRFALVGGGAGPRGFSTWDGAPSKVAVEGHAEPSWAPGLASRGHEVTTMMAFDHTFGHAQVIVCGDVLAGAADPRPETGAASGW